MSHAGGGEDEDRDGGGFLPEEEEEDVMPVAAAKESPSRMPAGSLKRCWGPDAGCEQCGNGSVRQDFLQVSLDRAAAEQ
jgi:hypothetical protein